MASTTTTSAPSAATTTSAPSTAAAPSAATATAANRPQQTSHHHQHNASRRGNPRYRYYHNNRGNSRPRGPKRPSDAEELPASNATPPSEPSALQKALSPMQEAAPAEDGETHYCFICTEPIAIFAVAECNHRTCHLCSLRLRALYKTRNCAYCKVRKMTRGLVGQNGKCICVEFLCYRVMKLWVECMRKRNDTLFILDEHHILTTIKLPFYLLYVPSQTEQATVILTSLPDKPFQDYTAADTPFSDKKLDARFETSQMLEDVMILLRFNCPEPTCDFACEGWSDLKRHVKRVHSMLLW